MYSVRRSAKRSGMNVFFLVQTDAGSDDELDLPPWQHPYQKRSEVAYAYSHVLLPLFYGTEAERSFRVYI